MGFSIDWWKALGFGLCLLSAALVITVIAKVIVMLTDFL
jgi:hypothetical protein